MKTEVYGSAKIEPYGTVKIGRNQIEFTSGMAFLNGRENDIDVNRGIEMIANYLGDVEIVDDGDNEPWVAVLVNGNGGLRYMNGGALHLFFRSLIYTEID